MARAGLGWKLEDLGRRSGVNLNTISRFEAGKDILSGSLHQMELALPPLQAGGQTPQPKDTALAGAVTTGPIGLRAARSREVPSPCGAFHRRAVHADERLAVGLLWVL